MKLPQFPILLVTALLSGLMLAGEKERSSAPHGGVQDGEAQAIEATAKDFLSRSVQLEPEQKATSHIVRKGKYTRIEWRNLVFRQLIFGTVSSEDRTKGISRRIYAQLHSESYRLIDADGTTGWRSGRCPGFPAFVLIEEINGEFVASAPQLEHFSTTSETLTALHSSETLSEHLLAAKEL